MCCSRLTWRRAEIFSRPAPAIIISVIGRLAAGPPSDPAEQELTGGPKRKWIDLGQVSCNNGHEQVDYYNFIMLPAHNKPLGPVRVHQDGTRGARANLSRLTLFTIA